MNVRNCTTCLVALSAVFFTLPAVADDNHEQHSSILAQLPTSPEQMVSTVPSIGDVNPYGVAFVPNGFREGGPLESGDILVSNFNASSNLQGTGRTIVRITPQGQQSLFFQGPMGLGLTTALGVLRRGFILVGNLPTDSMGNPTQGSLLVIDRHGNMILNLTDSALLNGPWDLTLIDNGSKAKVFVSNVLSGTVTRINVDMDGDGDKFRVVSKTQIASGYGHRTDPNALVVGPTGLAYDRERDLLYVASTDDNEIFAVPDPKDTNKDNGAGMVIYQDNAHLRGPLALALAPNGNLITANGDAQNPDPTGKQFSELIEFTRDGTFVAQFQVDTASGAAFGLAVNGEGGHIRFAAVDDATNVLDIWKVRLDD